VRPVTRSRSVGTSDSDWIDEPPWSPAKMGVLGSVKVMVEKKSNESIALVDRGVWFKMSVVWWVRRSYR
jgi:hypothetical protein